MVQEKTGFFEHEGRQMVYDRLEGPGERAFVLVHGIGMGRKIYTELAAELARHGTVYAVDLPGFGESPRPESPLPMAQTGDFLAEFIRLKKLVDPVLVGHSMGGQVVAEALARHPEVSSCGVLIAPSVNRAERTVFRQGLRMVQDLAGESPKVLLLGSWQYAKAGLGWFLSKMRHMLAHRLEETCPQIRADVLVLRGDRDRVCPRPWIEEITGLIPAGRMEEIPGCGHEAVIKSPQPAARLILEHSGISG
ncbi:alpha/beta fold hydrolase [Nesterenkonia ebinurensis]|uniref:alpha/beta fold hydrolase n=1 Tax=Nesterenkonia ebinurensis TaxID=2608252 RepID=UPI00123C8305|nr:alpha/beta hydrolase [Nesterenkonia ebinurensis]